MPMRSASKFLHLLWDLYETLVAVCTFDQVSL
jgi:hypothetical protein